MFNGNTSSVQVQNFNIMKLCHYTIIMFHHDRKFLANQKNHRKIDPVDLFKGDAESVVTGELLRAGTDTTRTSGGGDMALLSTIQAKS